ncbi:MAG: hypothetical protein L6R41_000449 [Letrouitia leprolyta]|nr:MAG: hypothetical protein L6R41_000449 [Letrouitia leprolyta]
MPRPPRRTDLPPERMTPIKIRGKRGQKARLQARKEKLTQRAASEDLGTIPEPARPMIECLPIEILEKIFLFSRDVALPQASLALGKAFSSTYIKHRLLRALFTDECMGTNISLIDDSSVGRLQAKFLRCRWVDLPSFKRALAASMTSMLAILLGKPTEIFSGRDPLTLGIPDTLTGTGCPLQDYSTAELSGFVDDVFASPDLQRSLIWPCHTKTKHYWSHWVSINAQLGSIEIAPGTRFRPLGYLRHPPGMYELRPRPGCEIPTRLLHGPWTTSKMEFLEFLKHIRATTDPESSNSHEVAMESLKEAVVQGDFDVVSLLTRRYGSERCGYYLSVSEEHVRLAILQGGCKRGMISLLKSRDYSRSIDWNQDDFVEWAIEHKARGDERGSWLLEIIETQEKTKDRLYLGMGG